MRGTAGERYSAFAEPERDRTGQLLFEEAAGDNGREHHADSVRRARGRLDIDNNPDMDIDDVIAIQDALNKNKQ